MITPSELFSPTFTSVETFFKSPYLHNSYLLNPRGRVNFLVKAFIEEIDSKLKKGIVSFETNYGEIKEFKNQDVIHQLICKLVNNETNKFGWITYIRVEYNTAKIILAVKESDLTSIEMLMAETNED